MYGVEMDGVLKSSDPEKSIRIPYERTDASEPLDTTLHADCCVRLPDHPIVLTDRMTMAHSLEARSPFMDHELAEFAAWFPVRMKVRGQSLWFIQYKLAERYLPKEILSRPKQGFSSALPYMLRDKYRSLFRLFLRDSALARAGMFAQQGVDELLAERQSGKSGHGDRLWLLLNSEVWYRMFVIGETKDFLTAEITDSLA